MVTNAGSIALATGSFPTTCDVYLSGTGKLILSNGVTLAVNRVFYKDGDNFYQQVVLVFGASARSGEGYFKGTCESLRFLSKAIVP